MLTAREAAPMPSPSLDLNTAAGKLLAVLDVFDTDRAELTLGDLAVGSGLPKSTVHRLLAVVEKWGGVTRTPLGGYRLGAKFLDLSARVDHRLRLHQVGLPYAGHLQSLTGERVRLHEAVDPRQTAIVLAAPGRGAGEVLVPLTCTAVGKVLLAFASKDELDAVIRRGLPATTRRSISDARLFLDELRRTRDSGLGYERGEALSRRLAIASPIFDAQGTPVAALEVSGTKPSFSFEAVEQAIRMTAFALNRELSHLSARNLGLRLATASVPVERGDPL